MPEIPPLPAVSCVREDDLDELRARLDGWGFEVLELDGTGLSGGADLWAAVGRQLPMPEGMRPHGWDALNDLLFHAVTAGDAAAVALVWTHADDLVAGDLQDLLTAAGILAGLSAALRRDRDVLVHTFLVGGAPGYRRVDAITA